MALATITTIYDIISTLGDEVKEYNLLLELGNVRTITGDVTFTSATSAVVYNTAVGTGVPAQDTYIVGKGQQGLFYWLGLDTVLGTYNITKAKWDKIISNFTALGATTDGSSGADQVGATSIISGGANTVQGILEAIFGYNQTGWIPVIGTWAYASTTTITVPSGSAAIYDIGDKFKLTSNSVELQGYIVGIADTLLTVKGDTLTNFTFSNVYFSKEVNPHGFKHWFTYAPTITWTNGITSPTDVIRFKISGREQIIKFHRHGTANGANSSLLKITLPMPATSLYSSGQYSDGSGHVTDGSTFIYPCEVYYLSSDQTVTVEYSASKPATLSFTITIEI